jgi:hypothetical protein
MGGFAYFTRTLNAAAGYCETAKLERRVGGIGKPSRRRDRAHPDVLRLRLGGVFAKAIIRTEAGDLRSGQPA